MNIQKGLRKGKRWVLRTRRLSLNWELSNYY